jgi:hypothetical protein
VFLVVAGVVVLAGSALSVPGRLGGSTAAIGSFVLAFFSDMCGAFQPELYARSIVASTPQRHGAPTSELLGWPLASALALFAGALPSSSTSAPRALPIRRSPLLVVVCFSGCEVGQDAVLGARGDAEHRAGAAAWARW